MVWSRESEEECLVLAVVELREDNRAAERAAEIVVVQYAVISAHHLHLST